MAIPPTLISAKLVGQFLKSPQLTSPDLEEKEGLYIEKLKRHFHQSSDLTLTPEILEEMFVLRVQFMQADEDAEFVSLDIQEKTYLALNSNVYRPLLKALEISASTYNDIWEQLLPKLPYERVVARFEAVEDPAQTYRNFRLLAQDPLLGRYGHQALVKKWIDASLAFEVAFIWIYLLEANELTADASKVKQLAVFLLQHIEIYGAIGLRVGVWTLSEDDERPLSRNMRILAATFESPTAHYGIDQLKQVLG